MSVKWGTYFNVDGVASAEEADELAALTYGRKTEVSDPDGTRFAVVGEIAMRRLTDVERRAAGFPKSGYWYAMKCQVEPLATGS